MKHLLPAAVATLTAASVAAGGIDQSRQPVDLLFKDGNYAQIGFGYWMPDVRGTDAFGGASGNVYGDISDLSFGVKRQITDRWSAALLLDQPWGVAVDYPGTSFPYAGTSARVKSASITGLVRYRFDTVSASTPASGPPRSMARSRSTASPSATSATAGKAMPLGE